jgi:hypothetical protein
MTPEISATLPVRSIPSRRPGPDRDGRPGEHAGDADDPAEQVVFGDDALAQVAGC